MAVAESGPSGAVGYLGEISNDPVAIGKLCERLARPGCLLRAGLDAVGARRGVRRYPPARPLLMTAEGGGAIKARPPDRIGSDIALTALGADEFVR